MKSRCWHRIQAFVLAVALGISMSLIAFQTSAMSPDRAASAGTGEHDGNSCGGCAGDGGDMDFGACVTMCWAGGPVVLPDGSAPLMISRIQQPTVPVDVIIGSPAYHPDPDPPKLPILG